jgi:hypothetical protein
MQNPPSPARPSFSALTRTTTPFGAKEPRVVFGRQWRELVLPVRVVRVKVNNGAISSIKNVVDDDIPRLELLGQLTADKRTSTFQLVEGEYITKVQVHMGLDYIHAIRFFTNKRVSPWVGKAIGTTREIAAPEGKAIHSLFGSWGHGLRALGAVFSPLSMELANPSEVGIKRLLLVELPLTQADASRATFTVSTTEEVGAVVVSADPDIKWIRVLSRRQVADLVALQDGIYPGDGEHWLQLMQGEVATGLEIVHDRVVIKGIRWTTTLQTTPWIGQSPTASQTRVGYTCPPHEHMCGFYGARGREGITALGVAVMKEEDEMAEDRMGRGDTDETASTASEQWDVIRFDSPQETYQLF